MSWQLCTRSRAAIDEALFTRLVLMVDLVSVAVDRSTAVVGLCRTLVLESPPEESSTLLDAISCN